VAFDSRNEVYLVVTGGIPVNGRFLDKNGLALGPEFPISLEYDPKNPTPWPGWSNVHFGGPAGNPTFLVTYIAGDNGPNTKYVRFVRYRPGLGAEVGDRRKLVDVYSEWNDSEFDETVRISLGYSF